MQFPEPIGLAKHILPERLFMVAARGETFQDEELQHLENCVLCQERFHQFVPQELQERGIIPPAERKILQFPRGCQKSHMGAARSLALWSKFSDFVRLRIEQLVAAFRLRVPCGHRNK